MPVWDSEAISDFLREKDGNVLCEIMNEFYFKTLDKLNPEQREAFELFQNGLLLIDQFEH